MSPLPRPSMANQRRLMRVMQAVLLGVVGYGAVAGQPKAIVNGTIAFLITLLPALLERNYELPLDPWLGLWITSAVLFHTLGSAGLYSHLDWWDHLTHSLSASLVAGAGYVSVRAVDLHTDRINLPHRYGFVFILVLVLAFGVVWELFEFALDVVSASTGLTMPLAQHGLDDTVLDLTYNSLGAVVAAVIGQVRFTGTAEKLRSQLFAEQ
ncbi:hypothetical protein [Halorussus rarus]|uniref:hypothetical protein n=1 Tax=Halorussus TaxID=1070314 RepID=UPI000E21467E|nr:hypothetical protein [Halorussus sp. JP-T4]